MLVGRQTPRAFDERRFVSTRGVFRFDGATRSCGVSFQQLLDEARKEASGRFLREQTLAICEVAYLVGYSEPAPFHRAFKRWYGMTPELFRQTHRQRSRRSLPR